MTACYIYYSLDFGLLAKVLGGKYTGETGNIKETLTDIGPHIDSDDLCHIERVLYQGCPSELVFEESR